MKTKKFLLTLSAVLAVIISVLPFYSCAVETCDMYALELKGYTKDGVYYNRNEYYGVDIFATYCGLRFTEDGIFQFYDTENNFYEGHYTSIREQEGRKNCFDCGIKPDYSFVVFDLEDIGGKYAFATTGKYMFDGVWNEVELNFDGVIYYFVGYSGSVTDELYHDERIAQEGEGVYEQLCKFMDENGELEGGSRMVDYYRNYFLGDVAEENDMLVLDYGENKLEICTEQAFFYNYDISTKKIERLAESKKNGKCLCFASGDLKAPETLKYAVFYLTNDI